MTRKSYKYIFLGTLLLGIMLFATPALAQGLVNCGNGTTPCAWKDLFTLINTVITFLIFTLGVPLVTMVIVVSGVMLVWNPNKSTAQSVWKNRLQTALLGLVIMLSAWLIVKAVVWGLTGGDKAKVDNYDLQSNFPTDPTSPP